MVPREQEERLGREEMSQVLSSALASRALSPGYSATVFYDFERLDERLGALARAFPSNALHAVAVKANPLLAVLKRIRRSGHGAEVASFGELKLALEAGFPVSSIVFDSPVKTASEIKFTLERGVGINANTLAELERIDRLYSEVKSQSYVGVRINPETGTGSIADTSVAVQHCKFGVSLREHRPELQKAFTRFPWLSGVHLHIGSQGMSLAQLIDGVGSVYDFFMSINQLIPRVQTFNIGGGLPAKYRISDSPSTFAEYAKALQVRCPALFDGNVCLVTEFGRSIHASCGWAASKIEYVVEHEDDTATILIHLGADMFLRKVYRPDEWHHDLSVTDPGGRLRAGPLRECRVAGPLCFAGDYLSASAALPRETEEGDFVMIHDAGAYTFSMWSMYNSRQFPPVLGYEGAGNSFVLLRALQAPEDLVSFWGAEETKA